MATFIAEYEFFQIEVSNDYKLSDWKQDMKNLLKKTGLENTKVVFLLNDSQIIDDNFLEDINTLLNSGDISSLFDNEEKSALIDKVKFD